MMARVTSLAVASAGVWAFKLLHLPLPWLLGPIFACLIAALCGVRMRGVKLVNDAMRTILGVAVGATFTTTLLFSMGEIWPTLLMIPVMTGCIGLLGMLYFQRIWGFDFATSYYSAMPGRIAGHVGLWRRSGRQCAHSFVDPCHTDHGHCGHATFLAHMGLGR